MMKKALLISCLLCWLVPQLRAQSTKAAQPAAPVPPKPFVLGEVHELYSKELQEKRVLNVYLPAGYSPKDTARYPVIYVLDGSADEDFIHLAGLAQFLSFPWVNVLPPSIVVGIANVDRRRDFTYPTTIAKDKQDFPTTGHSAAFIGFLDKELQPYVTGTFRTRGPRTLIGQSLGGLLATEVLLKKPQLFTQYVIVSPSLWWDNGSLLHVKPAVLQPQFTQPTAVFITQGEEGKEMKQAAEKLVALLTQQPKENLTVRFEPMPEENHATILHLATYRAFQRFRELRK